MVSALMMERPSGAFLYKYGSITHISWLRDILLKHELYFSNPSEFQDPLDARPAFRTLSIDESVRFLMRDYERRHPGLPLSEVAMRVRELREFAATQAPDKLTKMTEESFHQEMEKARIYCLTTRSDNEHLWHDYARNHTGYCLEFRNAGVFAFAHHVRYVDHVELDPLDPQPVFLWQKTLKYQREEEVRVLLLPRGQPARVTFDPSLLSRVILGRRMGDRPRRRIRRWAEERNPTVTVAEESDPDSSRSKG